MLRFEYAYTRVQCAAALGLWIPIHLDTDVVQVCTCMKNCSEPGLVVILFMFLRFEAAQVCMFVSVVYRCCCALYWCFLTLTYVFGLWVRVLLGTAVVQVCFCMTSCLKLGLAAILLITFDFEGRGILGQVFRWFTHLASPQRVQAQCTVYDRITTHFTLHAATAF